MRIWTGAIEEETEVVVSSMGRRAWRRTLDVGWIGWTCFGVWRDTELRYETAPDPKAWREIGVGYRHAWIGRPWVWGESHDYYDGPHCGWSLGFLHFDWSLGWCLKCMPPDDGGES